MSDSDNIALFDMDGTLFDLDSRMLEELRKMRSPSEPEVNDPWQDEPWLEARRSAIKRVPGFWRTLPRFQLGWDILDMARDIGFSIHILTKGPSTNPAAWAEKLECIRQHLGMTVTTHVTEDKSIQYGKVLVDDYVPYVEGWLRHRPRGLAILPAHVSNKEFRRPNAIRYESLEDVPIVRAALKRAFERRGGEE